ncbi:MAG TPA: hypothetical protein DDZ67_09095 [Xanthomonadaceae bacterium]|nr:hypothetical protein [Xanthomonadaceae bacterium]
MSSYRKGVRLPDPVVCATIAGLSGIPLAKVLGIVGEARAVSREEKAVWRKLAATALGMLCVIGLSANHMIAKANPQMDQPADSGCLYIM